jgi:HEAT repeat protein
MLQVFLALPFILLWGLGWSCHHLCRSNFMFFQSGDDAVKESVLSALKGVVRHAGKSVSSAIRSRGCALLKDLLEADADDVRSSAAKAIGTLSQVLQIVAFF